MSISRKRLSLSNLLTMRYGRILRREGSAQVSCDVQIANLQTASGTNDGRLRKALPVKDLPAIPDESE